MVDFKSTRSAKVVVITSLAEARKNPHLPPLNGIDDPVLVAFPSYPTDPKMFPIWFVQGVSQHLLIFQPSLPLGLAEPPNQPLPHPMMIVLGMTIGLHLLQVNLGVWGEPSPMNNMYNMMQ